MPNLTIILILILFQIITEIGNFLKLKIVYSPVALINKLKIVAESFGNLINQTFHLNRLSFPSQTVVNSWKQSLFMFEYFSEILKEFVVNR